MLLLRVAAKLLERQIPFAVVGGYAVNLHGFIRSTVDVDLLIPLEKTVFIAVEQCMQDLELSCRVPVTAIQLFENLEKYRSEKNMKVWSFFGKTKPWDIVDFLITHDLRDFAITMKKIENTEIPVIDLEGLIRLKKDAGRRQDIEDIQALEKKRTLQ